MRIMATIGKDVLAKLNETNGFFVKALHSVGAPGARSGRMFPWPATPRSTSSSSPRPAKSGPSAPVAAVTHCWVRSATHCVSHPLSVAMRGWMAEHMLILKVTNPEGKVRYISAAFPSACGKTNFAMMEPTIDGWKAEMVGDDIAWIEFDENHQAAWSTPRLACSVWHRVPVTHQPECYEGYCKGNTIFTNVALTDDGSVWWEAKTDRGSRSPD